MLITPEKIEMCDKCGKNEAECEASVTNVEGSRELTVLNLCENCMIELINKLTENTQEANNDDNT